MTQLNERKETPMPRQRIAADLCGYWLRDDGPRRLPRRAGTDDPDGALGLIQRLLKLIAQPRA
ncbi:MAG: hypothetical protein AAFQ88_08800 [Pseudomonadota bacterium]